MSAISPIKKRPLENLDPPADQPFPFMTLPILVRIDFLKHFELDVLGRIAQCSRALKLEARDPTVWRYKARYLGLPYGEGKPLLIQVKMGILVLREIARELIHGGVDLTTFERMRACLIHLNSFSDLMVLPWIREQFPNNPLPTNADPQEPTLNPSTAVENWCSANKQELEEAGLIRVKMADELVVKVPLPLYFLKRLQILLLSNNRISSLDPLAGKNWKALKTLDLSNNSFKLVPEEVRNLPQLDKLNIFNNQITELPEWIGELQLSKFRYDSNPIAKLPEGILKLFLNNHYRDHYATFNRHLVLPLAELLKCPIEEELEEEIPLAEQIGDFIDAIKSQVDELEQEPPDEIKHCLEFPSVDGIHYVQNWLKVVEILNSWDDLASAIRDRYPGFYFASSGQEDMVTVAEFYERAARFPEWTESNADAILN